MNTDELFSYLIATDQIDEFFGLKSDNTIKCENCNSDLFQYEGSIFYCKKCNILSKYNINKKTNNKKLTFQEKIDIDDRM